MWFRAAGDAAKTAFANQAAVDHYERLLPLLSEPQAGEVLLELGAVWQLTGRWADAERAHLRAMGAADFERLDDPAGLTRILNHLAFVSTKRTQTIIA